ncbi:MAG: hypothetical protein ACYS30_14035, partial [Planctomycetota bacterium]
MFTRAMFTFLLSMLLFVTLLAAGPVYSRDNQGGQDSAAGKRADSEAKNKEPSAAQRLNDLIANVKREKGIQPDKVDEAVDAVTRASGVVPAVELLNKLGQLQQYRQDSVIPTAQRRLSRDMSLDYTILSLQ